MEDRLRLMRLDYSLFKVHQDPHLSGIFHKEPSRPFSLRKQFGWLIGIAFNNVDGIVFARKPSGQLAQPHERTRPRFRLTTLVLHSNRATAFH